MGFSKENWEKYQLITNTKNVVFFAFLLTSSILIIITLFNIETTLGGSMKENNVHTILTGALFRWLNVNRKKKGS